MIDYGVGIAYNKSMEETPKKYKYQNISDSEQNVVNFGLVQAGETIETDEPINNPNFELVKDKRMVGIDPATNGAKRGIDK